MLFSDVQALYDKALLLEDRDMIRLVCASVVANQMKCNPVWLMLVSSSSSGKTAVLQTLDGFEVIPGVPHMWFISDITENTFASGFKGGKDASSLLDKIPYGGIMIFKDFTSMLSKRKESRDVVMGQLREIYDGRYDKRTGNQQDTAWRGHIGALAGVTEAVHEYMPEMSAMGDRFIMYTQKLPDRKKLLKFIMDMRVASISQNELLDEAGSALREYIHLCLPHISLELNMKKEDREHLMEVCDFVTRARSGVIEDQRSGAVRFVPSAEMPTRIIDQMLAIAQGLCVMRLVDGKDTELDNNDMKILYKIAFDSIPLKRLWALRQIAGYLLGVTSAGVGQRIGYETEIVRQWMAQLAALGIVHKLPGARQDMWKLNEEYLDIMRTYQHIQIKNEVLESDSTLDTDEWIVQQKIKDNDW